MGNIKSKKSKEPDGVFVRARRQEEKKNAPTKKMIVKKEPQPLHGEASSCPPAHIRTYDDEAIDRMRYQLHNDSDAFLLNNILLSVQFFENYESEVEQIKRNPHGREHNIKDAMVRHHKNVYFADQLAECVRQHVYYQQSQAQQEPLLTPRLFVIYENVEPSEPGESSDYSAVLDVPFYKLCIENCKDPGYVKLRKLEVLESTLCKETCLVDHHSDDSVYTESDKESNDSDDSLHASKGEELLQKLKNRLSKPLSSENLSNTDKFQLNSQPIDLLERKCSGPIKHVSVQVAKSNITNLNFYRNTNESLHELKSEESNMVDSKINTSEQREVKPNKSILKNSYTSDETTKDLKNSIKKKSVESTAGDDADTSSGYNSNSSVRRNDLSETDSEYGYSTITESTTPKRVELSIQSNYLHSSGVIPHECWTTIQVSTVDNWGENENADNTSPKLSLHRKLYETYQYLGSSSFMTNFVDNFMIKLGSGLGFSQDAINNALTQGASIYCDAIKDETKLGYEVFPALLAPWPNAANQWIIRERKIVQNPRTNFSYQWPTKHMVNKVISQGCLLIPVGLRSKRGVNPDSVLQWRVTFPAAEHYLESCLAHSHMRCYLFTLVLHKTFMENATSKLGIDASHIKNHLFWQCEDNYARWPEDRLGETLRLFLRRFYVHFKQSRFPNYFVDNCNDFESIPNPLLLKLQRQLADIIEAPVMHVLNALEKLKYTKKDFYPTFNSYRLYEILTHKHPSRTLLNPSEGIISNNHQYSDSEDERESETSHWYLAKKAKDRNYQWQREYQRQIEIKRKANKKHKSRKKGTEINKNIILPKRMEAGRRILVLEFFIPHFIAMARSSEKFKAIKQAVIYLEQAQRLCTLLSEEPDGGPTANEYFDVIRDKLADCKRKLVKQGGYKLPPRRESHQNRTAHLNSIRKQRPTFSNMIHQDSPTDNPGISAFTFVEAESPNQDNIKLTEEHSYEESKM